MYSAILRVLSKNYVDAGKILFYVFIFCVSLKINKFMCFLKSLMCATVACVYVKAVTLVSLFSSQPDSSRRKKSIKMM